MRSPQSRESPPSALTIWAFYRNLHVKLPSEWNTLNEFLFSCANTHFPTISHPVILTGDFRDYGSKIISHILKGLFLTMWDVSLHAVIPLFFSFFSPKRPDNWLWRMQAYSKHEGLQRAHIVIAFNMARPVVTFKGEAATVWHRVCGADTHRSLSVCLGSC